MRLFKNYCSVKLPGNMFKASDTRQFNYCNNIFKDRFNSEPLLRKNVLNKVGRMSKAIHKSHPEYEFNTRIFLEEIAANHNPPGFTWHHTVKPGVMNLVETTKHENKPHTGGRSIWGGGARARRYGKIGD